MKNIVSNPAQGDAPTFDRSAWLSVKHTLGLDFPNLPYLVDREAGVKLTQSMAILKHVAMAAKKPLLVEGSAALAPYLDMLANAVVDFRDAMV